MVDEYRYTCTECGEEVYDNRTDLTDCPYCRHALSAPVKLEDIAFAGRGSGRIPCITDLV